MALGLLRMLITCRNNKFGLQSTEPFISSYSLAITTSTQGTRASSERVKWKKNSSLSGLPEGDFSKHTRYKIQTAIRVNNTKMEDGEKGPERETLNVQSRFV